MRVPVVWWTGHDGPARGYWDQGQLAELLTGGGWRPPCPFDLVNIDADGGSIDVEDGAVVVLPGRFNGPAEVDRLNVELGRLRWVLLIVTSDEESLFPWQLVQHPNLRWWVMTPRPDRHPAPGERWFYIGEGAAPPVVAELDQLDYTDRPRSWCFAGQVTHTRRRQMVSGLDRSKVPGVIRATDRFAAGLDSAAYAALLATSKVAPAPSGPATQDSFRFYEALEAGCYPLPDAVTPDGRRGYWPLVAPGYPGTIVEQWAELATTLRPIVDAFPANAVRTWSWWQQHKRVTAHRLHDDIAELSGCRPYPSTVADLVTVLVPTSPIPSHPRRSVIDITLDSIAARFPGCETLVLADGVRPEQAHYERPYAEYLHRLLHDTARWRRNTVPVVHDQHLHQAVMTRRALELVRTPLVLFVEHDTPLEGEWPVAQLVEPLLAGHANVIRFHHEADVLDDHLYLMPDRRRRKHVAGVPLLRCAQWSQRPHLATVAYYDRVLSTFFGETSRTMIEDVMHGVLAEAWHKRGLDGWGEHRVWMYAPDGSLKRSSHTDGRADDPKFPMIYAYDGPTPPDAPAPTDGRAE